MVAQAACKMTDDNIFALIAYTHDLKALENSLFIFVFDHVLFGVIRICYLDSVLFMFCSRDLHLSSNSALVVCL